MQFSYAVSEADYLNAWKIRRRGLIGSRAVLKTILFWVFVLVCLMLVWGVVQRSQTKDPVQPAQETTSVSGNPWENVLPFLAIVGIWVFIVIRLGPRSVRRLYRKDPAMQGAYSVRITPESIAVTNTAGLSMQAGWNFYESWREGKNLIVLVLHSGTYFILGLSGLSDVERGELRGILAAAIPHESGNRK